MKKTCKKKKRSQNYHSTSEKIKCCFLFWRKREQSFALFTYFLWVFHQKSFWVLTECFINRWRFSSKILRQQKFKLEVWLRSSLDFLYWRSCPFCVVKVFFGENLSQTVVFFFLVSKKQNQGVILFFPLLLYSKQWQSSFASVASLWFLKKRNIS